MEVAAAPAWRGVAGDRAVASANQTCASAAQRQRAPLTSVTATGEEDHDTEKVTFGI